MTAKALREFLSRYPDETELNLVFSFHNASVELPAISIGASHTTPNALCLVTRKSPDSLRFETTRLPRSRPTPKAPNERP